jgi:ATP-dependent helicase/nuclease subunit A
MELWDYPEDKDNVTNKDITAFATQMHEQRRMDKDQIDAIRPADVVKFLSSPLATRMKAAKASKNLFREQPFVIGIPEEGETILVQGIIDAYFVEDDGISIVDYKTDHGVSEEMLINRYRAQLEYYGKALNQITGKPIKALTIYSTALGREIDIPNTEYKTL